MSLRKRKSGPADREQFVRRSTDARAEGYRAQCCHSAFQRATPRDRDGVLRRNDAAGNCTETRRASRHGEGANPSRSPQAAADPRLAIVNAARAKPLRGTNASTTELGCEFR